MNDIIIEKEKHILDKGCDILCFGEIKDIVH